ncbi:hypothetical protein [Sphingosinicella sp. BN140058]|uniref:hypothetical protein n=1 Tax=Sphingosinicella sp. BN140058 TaxID=1892855 RepID=UPI0010112AB5|nr:hypothetical protein [Sphingosinicella sp. BN140058]QAY77215.1 hypothetical protein ETR14_12440 [Sphingosinicella sp. BN140058]
MRIGDEISFHSQRARIELDLAARAGCARAAQAHFGLSQLHLDRMRDLAETRDRSPKPRRPSLSAAT